MRTKWRMVFGVVVALAAALLCGCVTVAEFRKLEKQVIDMQRERSASDPRQGLADVSLAIDQLESELRQLRGQLEVNEKTASDALAEARRARQELAARAAKEQTDASTPSGDEEAEGESGTEEVLSDEVVAYRLAYAAWRAEDYEVCIDRFRKFLQTYPSSVYADDAAFWMADCHFRQGDFKNAVLRFDDVVRNYPTGNKAPDALYRQGESLLKLGPGFHEAAKRAFERVIKEYPDSARAEEANRQIELLAAG